MRRLDNRCRRQDDSDEDFVIRAGHPTAARLRAQEMVRRLALSGPDPADDDADLARSDDDLRHRIVTGRFLMAMGGK